MASSLRKRILSGYGISLALMAVVLVWAVANLVGLGQASDAILRENYQSILAAENMIGAIERQDSATLLVMLDYEDEGLVQFGENKAQFLNWLDRAGRNITVPGEADIVKAIETGYEAYLDNFSHLRQMRGQSPQQAGKYYHETVLPSFKGVRDEAARLREINQKAMESASRRASQVSGITRSSSATAASSISADAVIPPRNVGHGVVAHAPAPSTIAISSLVRPYRS